MMSKVDELIERKAEAALLEIQHLGWVARYLVKARLDFFMRSQGQKRRREAERKAKGGTHARPKN